MDGRPVVDRIAALRASRDFVLVGVGGHGGAGKTPLARSIPGAEIVSTDEFDNPVAAADLIVDGTASP